MIVAPLVFSCTLVCMPFIAACTANAQTPRGEVVAFMADPNQPVAPDHRVRSFHGEVFKPATGQPGSWPGVVLIPGVLGLTDSTRREAASLAASGYQVLVIDVYEGEPLPQSGEEGERRWAALDGNLLLVKAEGAMSYLQNWTANPEMIGAVGEGDGGTLAIRLADVESHLKAAVDFGGAFPDGVGKSPALMKRVLIDTGMVPNEGAAVRFLNAHLKPR